MTDLDFHVPEFTIALRGYDRLQVDRYIDRLQGLLEETEERLRAVEPDEHHHEVGPRIAQIFDLAAAEAQDIRAGAEAESTQLLESARNEARAVVEANQAEWEGMLAEYEAERDRIQREVDELRGQKTTVLEEVRRLHQALGAASGLGSAPPLQPGDERPEVSEASEAQTRLLDPPSVSQDDPLAADLARGDARQDERTTPRDESLRDDQTREFETIELPPDLREAS